MSVPTEEPESRNFNLSSAIPVKQTELDPQQLYFTKEDVTLGGTHYLVNYKWALDISYPSLT